MNYSTILDMHMISDIISSNIHDLSVCIAKDRPSSEVSAGQCQVSSSTNFSVSFGFYAGYEIEHFDQCIPSRIFQSVDCSNVWLGTHICMFLRKLPPVVFSCFFHPQVSWLARLILPGVNKAWRLRHWFITENSWHAMSFSAFNILKTWKLDMPIQQKNIKKYKKIVVAPCP